LNEALGKIRVIYSVHLDNFDGTRSSDILYRESSLSNIAFGPPMTLMSGKGLNRLEYTTSSHNTYNPGIVIMGTVENANPLKTVGVIVSDPAAPEFMARAATKAPVTTPSTVNNDNHYKANALALPNPFNNGTTINFTLSQTGRYTVSLYDVMGRKIKVIRQGYSEAGIRNNVPIDGSQLSNGVYHVNIQTDQQVQTIMLLKW
jgi:hypothetical protein